MAEDPGQCLLSLILDLNMASDPEQETRLCGNCKRDIPFINFTIHEIHCKRNISVCKLCKEPFPTSEMEEHVDTEHAPVTCKCKMTIEKRDLEEHELSACRLRLVKCVFCELELAFNKLGEHVDYCGARTECCEKCGRSVMKKDLVDHPEVCGKETAPKKPARAHNVESSDLDIDGAWFEWDIRNSFVDNRLPTTQGIVPRRFYRDSFVPESTKTKFNGLGEKNKMSQPIRNRPKSFTTKQPVEKVVASSVPNRELQEFHSFRPVSLQNGSSLEPDSAVNNPFWSSVYSKESTREESKAPHWLDAVNNESPDLCPLADTYDADDIQLPCEFCDKLIPEHELILHQSGCNQSAFTSVFNGRSSPKPQRDYQLESKIDWLSKPSFQSKPPVSTFPPPLNNDSPSVLIPCEFCGIVLEQDVVFHHQDQCDMGPTSGSVPSISTVLPSKNYYYREETGFEEKLSHEDDAFYSYKNNLQKENSSKSDRPKPILSSLQPSHVDELRIDEDVRIGRNQRVVYSQSTDYTTTYGSDYGASTRRPLNNTRNHPKAEDPGADNNNIEKE